MLGGLGTVKLIETPLTSKYLPWQC